MLCSSSRFSSGPEGSILSAHHKHVRFHRNRKNMSQSWLEYCETKIFFFQQLPNFSMYQGQPAHIAHMKVKSNMPQFFMPDELKMEILNRNALTMAHIDLGQNIGKCKIRSARKNLILFSAKYINFFLIS